jgi:hypothetical protein
MWKLASKYDIYKRFSDNRGRGHRRFNGFRL